MRILALAPIFAAVAALISASGASAQEPSAQALGRECELGVTQSCLKAATAYRKTEDKENPVNTMRFSKIACDRQALLGCKYYAMVTFGAALEVHQRVIKTKLSGDPKGEWKTIAQLNAGVDRAESLYRTAQKFRPELMEDWDGRYKKLDGLRE